jgi:hypothetical protein
MFQKVWEVLVECMSYHDIWMAWSVRKEPQMRLGKDLITIIHYSPINYINLKKLQNGGFAYSHGLIALNI